MGDLAAELSGRNHVAPIVLGQIPHLEAARDFTERGIGMNGDEDDRRPGLAEQTVCHFGALFQGQVAVVAAGEYHALFRVACAEQPVQRQAGLQHDLLLPERHGTIPEVMGVAGAGILSAVSGVDQDGANAMDRSGVGAAQQPAQLGRTGGRQQHRAGTAHDVTDEQRLGTIDQHPRRAHPQRHLVVVGGQYPHLPHRVPLQHGPHLLCQFEQVHVLFLRDGAGRRHGFGTGCHHAQECHQPCCAPRPPHHASRPFVTGLSITVIIVRFTVPPE